MQRLVGGGRWGAAMPMAYIAANTLEVLSMRVARRSSRGAQLVSAAEQLHASLRLLYGVPVRDREIYLVTTRRIVRHCARVWLAARRAGIVDAEEHHDAREAMIRVLAATPAPSLPRRRTASYLEPRCRFVEDVELGELPPTIARCLSSERG